MIGLALAFAIAQQVPRTPGLEAVSGLEGCWRVTGRVEGQVAPGFAKGEWHLGGRYLMLHLRVPRPGDEYEAAITYGAGERPNEIGSLFSDTFGGLYGPSLGAGAKTSTGFEQRYRFPDSVYLNRFERQQGGWHWTILEQVTGREDRVFADYQLEPSSCDGMNFTF